MKIKMFPLLLFTLSNFYFQISYAQYTEIDLREKPTDAKNYVGIVVRDNTTSGHAFVILAKENPPKVISELHVQGFYPKKKDGGKEQFKGEGIVENDFASLKYVRDSDQVYFIVSDNDYNSAVAEIKEWIKYPPKFNIFTNNCINLTQNVAQAIGINLPSRLTHPLSLTPKSYLNLIKEELYSKNGIDYKNNSKIKIITNGTFIGNLNDGKPEGDGKLISAIDVYKGAFKDGKPNGNGELTMFISSDKIVGNFIDGRPQGKIKIVHGNVDAVSSVEIRNGKYVGQTTTIYKDGSKQITQTDDIGMPLSATFNGTDGAIENIKFNGKGQMESALYVNSDKSVEIVIDKFYSGQPDYTHGTVKGNGYRYVGDLKFFRYHGKGTLTSGNNKWEGDFVNGRLEGKNVHIEIDGTIFDGEIKYDENHSYQNGLLRFLSGDTYNGELRDFRFHGKGRLIHNGEKDCLFLGLLCNSNSFDITDTFTNGTSPALQKMGVGLPPNAAFPDTQAFKVPIDLPNKVKEDQNKTNPNNITPPDYRNLDPVPKTSKKMPHPQFFTDPVTGKKRLL